MPHNQPIIPVRAEDGHRFELIHAPADTAKAGLLFLPGMGLSARQYIRFSRSLATLGIETVIHEWRGLGSSSLRASRFADWGYREFLELDLAAAVDATRRMIGGRPLIIGGHSLGSQLALLAAARRPRDCHGLIIVAGGAPYWRCFRGWMRPTLRVLFRAMPAIALAVGHYPGRQLGFAGREARGVIADWAASGRTGVYRPLNIDFDLETALANLTCPALAVRMLDDWFVPQASMDWLVEKLVLASRRQIDISNNGMDGPADHYRWMKQPASAAAAIADWWTSPDKIISPEPGMTEPHTP